MYNVHSARSQENVRNRTQIKLYARGGRMGGELAEGVGEQKPTSHDQNTTSNPAPKTTSTQAFQENFQPCWQKN